MSTSIDFFNKVNNSLVTELDILNFIDTVTNNDLSKLNQLYKDLETFEVEFISSEVVETLISKKVYNSKSISDLLISFKKIVFDKIDKFEEKRPPEIEPIDLSDTSAVEKIIYLQELGIIEFLRNNSKAGISNSGLASVLSAITGEKKDTIKPSLNRLDNKDTLDNRHPYFNTKTVQKVTTKLKDLGF